MYFVTSSKASTRIELHPAAREAYEWTVNFPRWVNFSALPENLILELSRQPLHGVMKREENPSAPPKEIKTFQFYSPLWVPQLWLDDHPPVGTLLIHCGTEDIKTHEITKAAWVSTLSYLINAVDPSKISEIRGSFVAHMPVNVHKELLKSKTLSDSMLCKWLGISRGTLVHQRKQKRTINTPTLAPPLDVITALNKEWFPDE